MVSQQQFQYGGFCDHCQTEHRLPSHCAQDAATALILQLATDKTIVMGQSEFSTDYLFGKARGQMFGVMLARDQNQVIHTLKAFSGQFNKQYLAPGWVPPIFDVKKFHGLNTPEEKVITSLSREISKTTDINHQQILKQTRRNRSRALMKRIHRLYILQNFKGEQRPMSTFFPGSKGMPTGAGDCCGPKLIHHAISNQLIPLGMIEFYFGKENKSGTKQHGHFYSSCKSGCTPILGFMLCGL